ncbi:MAG: HAD hydrolase-like protein, partial [Vicinamibacterales bacterium]
TVGIWRSINYALAAFAYPAVDEQTVSQYIGPPLDVVFRQIAPMEADAPILGMVAKYRERYGEVGYAENVVYAGIPDALASLASHGVPMGVCTSKRADFAERILARFHLRRHFDFISGGDVGVGKDHQLRMLLESGTADPGSVMIGDRAVDVIAARAAGLRSVGVLWGHGSLQELQDAAPDRLLDAPDDLKRLVNAV